MQSNVSHDSDFRATPVVRSITDAMKDPMQVLDLDYRVVWSNSYTVDGQEWGPENLLGKRCYKAFFGRSTVCPDCPVSQTIKTGKRTIQDKMVPLPRGSYQWRQVHSWPIIDSGGRPAYVVKIGFDVTEQRQRQGRLEKYLAQLEASVRNIVEAQQQAPAAGLYADSPLTPRELEVLQLVAQGLTNANIAGILGLSPNTIKTHIGHIFDKLQVNDRTQAAVLAARLDII